MRKISNQKEEEKEKRERKKEKERKNEFLLHTLPRLSSFLLPPIYSIFFFTLPS